MNIQSSYRGFQTLLSRRRLLRTGLAAFGVLAATGLAACGDDDPEPDEETPDAEQATIEDDPTATAELEVVTTTDEPTPTVSVPSGLPDAAPTPTAVGEPETTDRIIMTTAWRRIERDEMPPARRDHSLVSDTVGRFAYLFGGFSSDGELNDLWEFDSESETWSDITPDGDTPAARFGHNAFFDRLNERLIVFGGQQGNDFFGDVWAFDVASASWTQIADTGDGPADRYGAGGAVDTATGTLYISHGFTSTGRFDDTWAFTSDNESWTDLSPGSGPRPEERCLLRTVADLERGRLVLFGGQSNSIDYLNDLWAFDLNGDGWTQLDVIGPSPRNLYTAVRPESSPAMIIYGGDSFEGTNSEIWILDLRDDTWSAPMVEGSVPIPRSSHDATWLPGRGSMLMFGGQANEELNDTWELTLDPEVLPSAT